MELAEKASRLDDQTVKAFWQKCLTGIGRPLNYELNGLENLAQQWHQRVKESGHKEAALCLGHAHTFAELDALSDAVANYLMNRPGMVVGDRVAIMMPNLTQYLISLIGVLKAGFIVVNCNPLYTKDEIEYQLRNSGAKILITLENVAKSPAEAIVPELQEVIVTRVGDLLPWPKRTVLNFAVRHIKKMVPAYAFAANLKTTEFRTILAQPSPEQLAAIRAREKNIKGKDIAFLQYTGGTTGVSKGAALSHMNMLINSKQAEVAFSEEFRTRVTIARQSADANNIKVVLPLPLYHIYSLTCGFFAATVDQGATIVTLPNPRELKKLIGLLTLPDVALCAMINTLLKALLTSKDFENVRLDPRLVIVSGGMATSPDVAVEWKKRTQTTILDGYGLTETSPLLAVADVKRLKVGSVGYPLAQTLLKLRDEQGQDLPLGAGPSVRGELLVKGPQVMLQYWKMEAENARIFSDDGYLMTGDIVTIAEDGMIEIVDRKKDMILVSGFNVYPNEIDAKVMATGLVKECAAIGLPDEKTGEKVVLYAVPLDESVTREQLQKALSEVLTNYKRPSQIVFADNLPKSPVGKILRREVKKLATSSK
ncbi:AMP-binding protein [Oligoflexus tunisiensis]|uniref:AMP-binding protein n=1 Tax=Oligoflexus tunisiensis TaxID=708132 RepID=UPI000B028902|nr:AMP-binding protein [Oligoflexus tunisiensis]